MWSKNIADENSIIMVIQNLSILLFLLSIDFFLLTTVTITHTMIITITPLTIPTSMPTPAHEALLVDVLSLAIGGSVCIYVELSAHEAQDWDLVAGVPVVMVTMDTMILIIWLE